MLGWLRSRFGPKGQPSGHPLESDFKSRVGGPLTARIMSYLLTGDDEDVLAALGPVGPALELRVLRPGSQAVHPDRAAFLDQLDHAEPAFVRRLAQVYAAAARGAGWEPTPSWKGDLEWLEPLVAEVQRISPNHYPRHAQGRLPAKVLEELLDDPADLYRLYLRSQTSNWSDLCNDQLEQTEGFTGRLALYPQPFHEALASKGTGPKFALEVLRDQRLPLEPHLPSLVQLLKSSSKTVRDLASSLLTGHPGAGELLYEQLPNLAPGDRLEALRHLASWGRRDLLRAWQGEEKTDKVLQGLEALLPAEAPPPPELPPAAPVEADVPLHPVVCEAVRAIIHKTQGGPKWQKIAPGLAAPLCDALETGRLGAGFKPLAQASAANALAALLDLPELTLPQAIRLIYHVQLAQDNMLPYAFSSFITRYRKRRSPRPTLLDVAAVLDELGVNPAFLANSALHQWYGGEFATWEPEAVWPYFATRTEPLVKALQNRSNDYQAAGQRQRGLDLVATFPVPPPEVHECLWYLAFNTSRPQEVQALLARVPGFEKRVIASLSDGKQEVRTSAAAWLARLRLPEAEAALRQALKKEKQELARAAMLTALESLGIPLTEFLNRQLLAKEAAKCSVPEGLSWFPFEQLPQVRWTDGSAVDPSIPAFWVVRAHKLKVPEANPLLRLYCQQLANSEELGRFVLGSWLARDAAAGSAVADKGLLALAGACGGGELVRASEHFLKTWYGQKAAQCKALLAMLASTGEPLALQLVLSVASRFRTKGIQEEAARQAQLLAERRGWTVAELADRSVPTAGLDPDGRLALDYGPRTLWAVVGPDFSLELQDENGKKLSSLPEPRQSDDAEKAAAAKKLLAAAKKELKSVWKVQKERLYEAMCTQRGWSWEDWRLFLWEHPLMRFFCQRLVWAVDGGPASFRPLADGALSDVEDRDVELQADQRITVAHQSLVPAAWLQHLADYEVEPLFAQFGRAFYTLPAESRDETELPDFEGHLLEAFRLRSRALALGYVRGETEDGGWFYNYRKSFQELSIVARLGFSGNGLPEENRTVALEKLSFERESGATMALGDVPPILLSECYRDLAAIAAEGTGFDPDWQTKVH